MSDSPADGPLQIEAVECQRVGSRNVEVRVAGKLRGRRAAPLGRALLVIEADGRHHRFPAVTEPRRGRIARPGRWTARFAIPAWLEPALAEHGSIRSGNFEIPFPPGALVAVPRQDELELGEEPAEELAEVPAQAPPRVPQASRRPSSELASEVAARVREALEQAEAQGPEDPSAEVREGSGENEPRTRSSPRPAASNPGPADSGVAGESQIVAALRSELQERVAAEVRLRGELGEARAALKDRLQTQEELEQTHAQLRGELNSLVAMIREETGKRAEVESKAVVLAAQVADLQERVGQLSESERQVRRRLEQRESELAEALVAREAAIGEVAGLRGEVERLGSELSELRGKQRSRETGLDEAQALLAEARALTASLRQRGGSESSASGEGNPPSGEQNS